MSILELELRSQVDGTATLTFWDSIDGNDVMLRISPDGTAAELSFDDDESDVWTPVDLVARLLELCRDDE